MLNGVWNWPNAWLTKAPNLGLVVVPTLNSSIPDYIKWREENGNMAIFSVKLAWEAFRPRGDEVWSLVRRYAGLGTIRPILDEITLWFQTVAAQRSFKVVVGKLLFAASSYFIWCERNNRLFKGYKRSPEDLTDLIIVTIRLKLVSFRFKDTEQLSFLYMETYGTIYSELPAIITLHQTEGGAAVCLYFSLGISRKMDQKNPVLCDEDSGKEFILCEYNRDADSYRSPWSNKFHPHLEDGMYPSEELRKLEFEANEVFTIYRDQ
ncbi:subunits of heterodimeric actin filament capping protein Capz superfamily protein [Tanacetum coccineum]